MLTGTDQIKILALDLVHHRIHLCKAHNSGHDITADHIRRNAISKASADHKITRIRKYCRMQSCNIAHQIVKAISGYTSGRIHINTIQLLHNFRMIWDFEIRNDRLTISLDFHVLTVIFSNRD